MLTSVFTDGVNQWKVLDQEKMICARMLEMEFFKQMGCARRSIAVRSKRIEGSSSVPRGRTDKGHRGWRSRLVGREMNRDLFSPTPPLEVLKLVIAYCAKNQHTDKPRSGIGVIDVSIAHYHAKFKRAFYVQIPDEDWELVSCNSAYVARAMRLKNVRNLTPTTSIASEISSDDFLVVASEEQLHWLNKKMQEKYETK